MAHHSPTSEELEREIEARRARIENRVDELAARLSPGQMLDEALRYTRNGPGAEFTRNLKRSVVENPLPVALVGAGLAWLAVQPALPHREHRDDYENYEGMDGFDDDDDYPLATIQGRSLQRVGIIELEGQRHSEFIDDSGRKFRCPTDETGHRGGHFTDEAGRMFRGFIDETGHRVSDFRDEAGNRMHQAAGWASHSWRKAGERASAMGHRMRDGAGWMGAQAQKTGSNLRRQGGNAVSAIDDFVHEQPLVSGLIAFALGALIGGAAPHTRQEDRYFGEAADSLRGKAAREAENLYERGKEEAAHLHDEARDAVSKAYSETKRTMGNGSDGAAPDAEGRTHH